MKYATAKTNQEITECARVLAKELRHQVLLMSSELTATDGSPITAKELKLAFSLALGLAL